LPRELALLEEILGAKLLDDPDAQVRMAALLAISEMPVTEAAGAALYAMLKDPRNSRDNWIPDAATSAAARHDAGFLKAVLADGAPAAVDSKAKPDSTLVPDSSFRGALSEVVEHVSAHYASRGPIETIVPLLAAVKGASDTVAMAVLNGLVSGWPQGKAPPFSEAEKQTLTGMMQSLPESIRGRLLLLARKWGRGELFADGLAGIARSRGKQIADASLSPEARVAAAKELISLKDEPQAVQLVLAQVNLLTSPELAAGLVGALAGSRNPETGRALASHWLECTPTVRRAVIATLLRRVEWASSLLDAVETGKIRRTDLASEHWSQLKLNLNSTLSQRAEKLSNMAGAISADRAEIVQKLLPLAKEAGEPARGQVVFVASCAVCHTFNGQGGKVGPDLTGIGARDRAEILIDILDPNRSVEANYQLWNVSTKEGETYSGRLDAETQTSVEILDATGQKHVIQRKDIETMNASQLSIMPNGFETLPPADLKGLLAYLTQPHS